MIHRSLYAVGALSAALLWSGAAAADPGNVTGNVNMRAGPGTQFSVITTIPAGAPIEVFGCERWCRVAYGGREGYVSGNYVRTGYAEYRPAPRVYYRPAPPPVIYWRDRDPWWDDDYPGWYWRDRHRWHDPWHRRHGGGIHFSFGF